MGLCFIFGYGVIKICDIHSMELLLTLLCVLLTLTLPATERKLFLKVFCWLLIILPPTFKECTLSLLAFVSISKFTISHAVFFKFII